MSQFRYIARDNDGQRLSGTLQAANRREALASLASRKIFAFQVEDAAPGVEHRRVRRVPAAILAVVYGQLADLLRSGVPLLRALNVVRNQTSHAGLKAVLTEIHRRVEDGGTLADAMAHFQHVLGEMAVSMVRAGGEGGFLEEALARVAQFTETQDDLKKRTMGAVAYPAFLAVTGTVIVVILMVFFVPKFSALFEGLRQRGELPLVTEWLLAVSGCMRSMWGLAVLALGAAGVWFARRWLRTEAGRWWQDRARLRVPLIGPVCLGLAVARFCRVLGTLLHNGVPILRSLQISRDATGNRVLAAAIGEATENISAGEPLAGPLAASGQFPPVVVEMIAVAEQANNLENVLLAVADSQERRTWRRLDLTVRLIEPIMLLVLAGIILVLVIALLLPVLKMSTTV
ncbi:MAG: type II secretion system F family protein [Thermoguttaceae bacterium]